MRADLRRRLHHRSIGQVTRPETHDYLIPWALLYDIPIQDGDPRRNRFCPVIDGWDKLHAADSELVQSCPFETSHTDDTVCP